MNGKEKGQALYRRYRSRSLDEVVGQAQVTEVLRHSLKQGKVAHAYLLTGPRGVGKTSIARILAHEINQLPYSDESTHLDIIEIDAASNNGVDDVRDLRDKVQLAPVSASKKVYIIDEVHMLSKPAFNALLKTLEEPPSHVVFILATTDLHKVPATIISRTQHFAFHSISPADLQQQLRKIADAEKMKVTDDALAAIAQRGDGSFRDSISLLDQLSSFADDKQGITLELVESTLGLAKADAVEQLLDAVSHQDVAAVITKLGELEQSGIQPTILADQLVQTLRTRLADHPESVTLLDALLTVPNSPQPQLKLLTVLVGAIKPKQSSAPAVATKAKTVVEAPIKKLEKLAEKPLVTTPARSDTTKRVARESEQQERITGDSSQLLNRSDRTRETAPLRDEHALASAGNDASGVEEANGSGVGKVITLDWPALIEETRKNHLALHSVLSKCTHELNGDTLTLYTGRKFNKTKLDDPKYLTKLHEALAAQGAKGLQIVTIPTTAPPADEKLAEIAAMMGGGQEVSLEEIQESA